MLHIEATNHVNVLLLHPDRHDSLRSISDTLTAAIDAITAATEEADEFENDDINDEQGEETNSGSLLTKQIVVVELTQLFYPDLLSDLIYLLSHVHQSPSANTGIHKNQSLSAAVFCWYPILQRIVRLS